MISILRSRSFLITRISKSGPLGIARISTANSRDHDPSPSLEKCSGCGVAFQESNASKPGYLPSLSERMAAFRMGVKFDYYQRTVLLGQPSVVEGAQNALDRELSRKNSMESAKCKTAASSAEEQRAERLLCRRCHSLRFQHALPEEILPNPATSLAKIEPETMLDSQMACQYILETIKKAPNGFVVAVCDVLDFPLSLPIPLLQSLSASQKPILLVANKLDVLPEQTNEERIQWWIRQFVVKELGIKNLLDVHLVSVRQNLNMDRFMQSLVKLRGPLDDVYVVGNTNVGKSSLVNFLLNKWSGPSASEVTTSWIPGTTLRQLSIPLKKLTSLKQYVSETRQQLIRLKAQQLLKDTKTTDTPLPLPKLRTSNEIAKFLLSGKLIDTPGIYDSSKHLLSVLTPREIYDFAPSRPIKPRSFYIPPGKSVWFGGLGRLDYVDGKAQMIVTAFAHEKLPIHVCDITKADSLWEKHGGGQSKNWFDSLFVDGRQVGKPLKNIRVERKNPNKDLWSSITLTPPYFTDPKVFLQSARPPEEGQDPISVEEMIEFGLLKDRKADYPPFQLALDTTIINRKPLSPLVHSSLHFSKSLFDVVFAPFGFLSLTGNFSEENDRSAHIQVWSPNGLGVTMRESLLPFDVLRRGEKKRGALRFDYRNADEKEVGRAIKADRRWWDDNNKRLLAVFENSHGRGRV